MLKSGIQRASAVGLLICLVSLTSQANIRADAIVVNKAMTASTIAEIRVEEDRVRVNLEIGLAGFPAFKNVFPDELMKRLELGDQPYDERIQQFFQNDWIIQTGQAESLAGAVSSFQVRKRIARDQVTGEPLLSQPADAEIVVSVELQYDTKQPKPSSLTFTPPMEPNNGFAKTNIGFVMYHRGLPVTDFRYLSGPETVDLDWNDPWYSRFRNPNLKRQYDSPASVFLYIEPFEVRKEIIMRPVDLQRWIDLDIDAHSVIPIAKQAKLKQQVSDFLEDKNRVTIDGKLVEGKIDRVHFIRRTLRKTGVVYPDEDLSADAATLGIIVVYPIESLPNEVSMQWELFDEKLNMIPASATDEAGGLPSRLTSDDPNLVWKNFLKNPTIPAMRTVPRTADSKMLDVSVTSMITILLALIVVVRLRVSKSDRKPWILVLVLLLVIGVATIPFSRVSLAIPWGQPEPVSDEQADAIVDSLLHNLYHAFDRRQEELVYDQLAVSLSGDVLSEIYLQTRQRIELEDQGGLQVKIDEVQVLGNEIESAEDGELICRCQWKISGTVGHWGHLHRRGLGFTGKLTIESIDHTWKITSMLITDESEPETSSRQP